ncbi:putative transcription factor ZF-HD family [Dioscorea sansibarensis]
MDLSVVPYSDLGEAAGTAASSAGTSRYRECMRNHAAAMGGQAYDGCGEFMPGGDDGSLEALKCAACGCHRNFHRREGAGAGPGDPPRPLLLYNPTWDPKKRSPPPQPPPGFPPFFPSHHPMPLSYHQIRPPSAPIGPDPSRDGSETPPRPTTADDRRRDEASRKRFRTKFTSEQKERMREFAERLGWRIQKHDDEALEEFCVEVGVKRHVLKVWMHNNKNALASHHATNNHHHHSATDSPRNPSPNRETSAAPTPIQV